MVNRHISEKHEELVKSVCRDIVSQETRSNRVTLSELAENERIQEELNVDKERPRKFGHMLTNVEWATKWSRGTYTIKE